MLQIHSQISMPSVTEAHDLSCNHSVQDNDLSLRLPLQRLPRLIQEVQLEQQLHRRHNTGCTGDRPVEECKCQPLQLALPQLTHGDELHVVNHGLAEGSQPPLHKQRNDQYSQHQMGLDVNLQAAEVP